MTTNLTWTTVIDSPVGPLRLTSDGRALTRLLFGPEQLDPTWRVDSKPFLDIERELSEFFSGTRRRFEMPIRAAGTPFQLSVWAALRDIPYGETRSYGQIAAVIGNPTAVRAVGLANSRNPLSIIVPCHRVVGANGTLTGYAGGLDNKRLLLDLERSVAHGGQTSLL